MVFQSATRLYALFPVEPTMIQLDQAHHAIHYGTRFNLGYGNQHN
jgi:hypothetical protein